MFWGCPLGGSLGFCRRITEATTGPLFADQAADGDETSGTIYVPAEQVLIFRSFQSTAIHKIGVTSGSGQERIAGARHDPTFPVEDFGYVQHLNHFYDIDLIKTSPRILPVSIAMHPPGFHTVLLSSFRPERAPILLSTSKPP